MEYLIIALQLILSLSILVVVHEFGHFLPAKLFKTKVEKFYLFFDPWFSLAKKKIGETEWGIGWLPLGGYVKIAGMIDESMDKDQMDKPAEPWEFRAKPAWQRLIIMVGGVTMNVILAWLIYTFMLMHYGEEYLPVEHAKYGVVCDSVLLNYGFQNGDVITHLEGRVPEKFSNINKQVLLEDARAFTVQREGQSIDIQLPEDIVGILLGAGAKNLFSPAVPFIIDTILPGSTASKSSLQKNDQIIAINEKPTPFFQTFVHEVQAFKNQTAFLTILRNSDTLKIESNVSEEGKLGIGNKAPSDYFDFAKIDYGFFAALSRSVDKTYGMLSAQVKQLKLFKNKEARKQIGGFGAFANLFSPVWNWQIFWEMTALLSLVLAFMNILPIPALDGGHVVFLIYEMITGRAPHQKVLEYAQVAGMLLLFGLMIYANGNDVVRSEWFQNLMGK